MVIHRNYQCVLEIYFHLVKTAFLFMQIFKWLLCADFFPEISLVLKKLVLFELEMGKGRERRFLQLHVKCDFWHMSTVAV